MSNHDKESQFQILSEEIRPSSMFEYHILQCCRAPEYQLRKWLKKVLVKGGFTIYEDTYKTDRANRDKRYEGVHNLLAIRGNPEVCLVAHTDVCREHDNKSSRVDYADLSEFEKWVGSSVSKDEFNKIRQSANQAQSYRVTPVVKTVQDRKTGTIRRIIQDKLCKFQVGGDDRLGVAINTWIALNSGFDLGLYFPTDEEIGLKSASMCEFPQLKEFDLLCQVDRGNHSRELVIKIGGEHLCSFDMSLRLLDIAYQHGWPRVPVNGGGTDVVALKRRGMCKNAVNMTCGYHNSHGSDPTEYIEISEARETMQYVAKIVEDFYLKGG